jgi:hypothetical protein
MTLMQNQSPEILGCISQRLMCAKSALKKLQRPRLVPVG